MVSFGRSRTAGKNPAQPAGAGPGRPTPGKSRTCPHCKSTILDSASICPVCQHHLRFDPSVEADRRAAATFSPLKVEGRVAHPVGEDPWEYSVVVSIRNEKGEEIARKVVGVGALRGGEERRFSLAVEVTGPGVKPPQQGS